MEKIIMKKGYGKTYQLIYRSSITGDSIVCHSKQAAHLIQRQAEEHGLKIPFPLTFDEFLDKKYFGKNIGGFLIDDVEFLIRRLSPGVPVNAITLSVE